MNPSRLVDWIPDVPKDMSWLYGLAEDLYKQAWKDRVEDNDGYLLLGLCSLTNYRKYFVQVRQA